ncbi:MAG: TolC family protein [Candidatus Eremiobacteraeota bacterium]|nr:TolC family protein [Candidatus Eremiobacteraeota bacterium]
MRPLVGLCFVLLGWTVGAAQPLPQLTPEEAMRQAAERLPSVQVAQALLESAQAYASSIGAQPNPFLRLSYIAGDPIEEANALAFRFEIAGQPGLREQSAQRSAEARAQDLATEKRVVALRTGQAYYAYWEKQGILRVAQERVELARSLERTSYRRFSVGEISQNQHMRAQLELARAQADEVTARQESEQAQGLMNLLLGRPVADPVLLPDGPVALPPLPSANQVGEGKLDTLQLGLEQLPEVEALRKEAAAQERQTELARRANAPELLLQFYRDRFGPTNVNAVQLSVTIPLWDWGTVAAEVGRREGLQRAAEARVAEKQLALQQRALDASKRYLAALEREKILADQATRFLKLSNDARRAYDANLMTLLEVFDVQQSYRQAFQAYLTAQADVARAALEIGALSPAGFFEEVSRVQP